MKSWYVTLAAAATALLLAAPAGAGHQLPHATPFHAMTLEQLASYQRRSLLFHQTVVGRWARATFLPPASRTRAELTGGPESVFRPSWRWCGPLGMSAPQPVCWHEHAAFWTLRELDATQKQLGAPAAASCGASAAACAWYWQADTQCEVSYEGGFGSVSPDGVYAGRFQSDQSFETETPFGRAMEARYGRANNWPAGAQIEHAHEIWLYSGWSRWPPYTKYGCAARGTGHLSGAV